MAATATYGQRLSSNAEWYVTASYQHVGNRYGEPADQEPGAGLVGNALWYDPETGLSGEGINDIGSLRLPSYNLFNLSAGLEFDRGLEVVAYVNNLFDQNPKLSIDRERGLRARFGYNIGTPRTIGLTLRHRFASEPAVVMAPPPPAPPPPAPAPATQTCADGSVTLATDACPAPPPPPPPPAPEPERG
jgi:iron complex outermembrane receptor protein